MKALFDTNVVLDVLLDRRPFSAPATHLFAKLEMAQLGGLLGATTLTTVHYVIAKARGRETASSAVRRLLQLFEIAVVDRQVLELAAGSSFEDFEDAVLHEAGRLGGADFLVTRDPTDFSRASLPVLSPEELLATLEVADADRSGE
jgi:predicted nucleic acid-binding protein